MNELLRKEIVNGHIGHAYLFLGEASAIAAEADAYIASVLCRDPREGIACGKCGHCLQYQQGTYPDLVQLVPEKTKYTVKQLNEIRHLFGLSGESENPIIFRFEKADHMEEEFADRLLKVLEEPTANVIFLLLAENEDMIRQTVKSRCRIFRFCTADTADFGNLSAVAAVLQKARCGSLEDVFHVAGEYEKSGEATTAFFQAAAHILEENYVFRNGGESPQQLLPAASWSVDLLFSAWRWALSAPVLISSSVTLRMIVENFLLWIKRNGGSHGNCSWCTL